MQKQYWTVGLLTTDIAEDKVPDDCTDVEGRAEHETLTVEANSLYSELEDDHGLYIHGDVFALDAEAAERRALRLVRGMLGVKFEWHHCAATDLAG